MAMPQWIIPTVSIVAACIVSLANFLVQRWRYRIDRLSVAADHICTEINLAADLSTEYWLIDRSDPEVVKTSLRLEPQIIGRQTRIQAVFLALVRLDSKFIFDKAENRLAELFDAMTGDTFQVSGSPPNPERAMKVQAVAARLNGLFRESVATRSKRIF